jgi:endonuclease/exonuclease/phosphatase family metal-dependent hydrolase
MHIKMIQVNIWKGKFLNELVAFLQKENADIITMQEVTAGNENFCTDKTVDLFPYLKKTLGMYGALAPRYFIDSQKQSYIGVCVLTKYPIITQNIVWLKKHTEILIKSQERLKRTQCNVLDVLVKGDKGVFHVLSTHGALTREPVDTPEKIRQAKLLSNYLRKLGDAPFLLGGDLNMPPKTQVISLLDEVAHNTSHGSTITRTTHPIIHKTAIIKPAGLLVDYIFTSKHFNVRAIDTPAVTVSDHLPVRAELEVTLD